MATSAPLIQAHFLGWKPLVPGSLPASQDVAVGGLQVSLRWEGLLQVLRPEQLDSSPVLCFCASSSVSSYKLPGWKSQLR